MRFRNPPALSSVLTVLGTLQLRAAGFLNRVDPLVSASNYYVVGFLRPSHMYMYMYMYIYKYSPVLELLTPKISKSWRVNGLSVVVTYTVLQ